MRARNIKPDFFRDAELSEVTIEARYLFIGLWCMADREGKLKDKPKQIRFEIFPETKTKDDIETLLTCLVEHNLIIRYDVDKTKYIKVVNFLKHQSPHHTEKRSEIPEPTVSHGELPLCSREIPLNPDSLNPDLLNIKDMSPGKPGNGYDPDFLSWWAEYPPVRKKGKPVCQDIWRRLKKTGTLPPLPEMITTLKAQKRSHDWQKNGGEFIPGPKPYLNGKQFIDESIPVGREPPACPYCSGSGFRKARPGETNINGMARCQCKTGGLS